MTTRILIAKPGKAPAQAVSAPGFAWAGPGFVGSLETLEGAQMAFIGAMNRGHDQRAVNGSEVQR